MYRCCSIGSFCSCSHSRATRSVSLQHVDRRLFSLVVWILLGCLCSAPLSAKPFVLGIIGAEMGQDRRNYQPIADYLARQLVGHGYERGELFLATDAQQLLDAVAEQRVDYVTETLFMAVRLIDEAGARPLLRRWRMGVPNYHSLIFVRADTGIEQLQDLRGQVLAFERHSSTSGFFIPAAELLGRGLRLQPVTAPDEPVAASHVGVYFSGSESATASLLARSLVAGAGVSNLDWINTEAFPPRLKGRMRVLYRSRNYPRALELVRSGLPAQVVQAIEQCLLDIHQQPAAQRILSAYQQTSRFTSVDADLRSGLESARRLLKVTDRLLVL